MSGNWTGQSVYLTPLPLTSHPSRLHHTPPAYKLGNAKFKVPKDKRKHKLEVRLSKKARKLLAKHHNLHLKIHYKISNGKKKSKPMTLVSDLTLKTKHGGKPHKGR